MLSTRQELKITYVKGFRQLEYLPATRTGDLLDEAMYWFAPEVLRTMEFTVMTDVWAFGITLWEMFSRGQTPFSEYDDWAGTYKLLFLSPTCR